LTAAIELEDVGVRFAFDGQRRVTTRTMAALRRVTEAWGLKHVSFSIGPGEGVALLGRSGSGKTSLLRLLAGVLEPDAGRLEIEGRVASLLSVEAGLTGVLTGRENALLLGVLAGMSRKDAAVATDSIRERSRLGDAFERPVLSYSEGMRARLGYAAVDGADTDILLLDEVHEALDHEFRQIVEHRAHDLLASGGIVVAAGHDHDLLAQFCDRAILLSDGRVAADGPFEDIRRVYLETVEDDAE
jgi:ABC-type polysaccharide/polyol phosphate transport system ATPase subunit